MYNATQLPVTPALAGVPIELPLNILFAVPEYEGNSSIWNFNLPASIYNLMGRSRGWKQVTMVMNPRIWAPSWDEDRVRTFVTTPLVTAPFLDLQLLLGSLRPRSLLVYDFPGSGSLRNPKRHNYPHYEIIHFSGRVARQDGDPGLDLGSRAPEVLRAEALKDALLAAQTRLLILQISFQDNFDAEQLAISVVSGGGPAVLVVYSKDFFALEQYFSGVYANITHSGLLPNLAQPQEWVDNSLSVSIFYGTSREDVFQFKEWMGTLNDQLGRMRQAINTWDENLTSLQELASGHLHRSQAAAFKGRLHSFEKNVNQLGNITPLLEGTLGQVSARAWDHESEGVIPLSHIGEAIPELEVAQEKLAVRYPQLRRELEEKAQSAPRVLNANFADPTRGSVLEPYEGLVEGREYDLLVDVGPRWNKLSSIVTGHADFPEYALPPDQEGYVVQVVVVSEDFSPSMASAQIWIPRKTGRSYPFVNGQRAPSPGPATVRLRAPSLISGSRSFGYARLCLYYENNLLQSGVMKFGVVRTEKAIQDEPNTILVDYVLTSSFQEVDERFARRAVRFTSTEDTLGQPVRLNLALNDDGFNGHRIIINHLVGNNAPFTPLPQNECPPRGWVPYDPPAAMKSLVEAREKLQSFFYQKDDSGTILLDQDKHPLLAINDQNGKTREQFKRDLFELALLGSQLYSEVFSQVNPEGEDSGCSPVEWMQDLEEALTEPSVIQVARTTPAQYVFPWALLYSYPMVVAEQDQWAFCRIIDEEWSEKGIRGTTQSEEEAKKRRVCCYHSEDWHASNVICPYGFWGLKHIIEQPPSVLIRKKDKWELRQAEKDIYVSSNLGLSIGATSDTRLNPMSIKQHLEKLAHLQYVRIQPPAPASDWNGVREMLTAPEVVYFLCHDEYDAVKERPYLSVGLHDGQPVHKIYSNDLTEWGRKRKPDGPDLKMWRKRHPLIFINGCHTADLVPGQILNFVTAFTAIGASGVVGTEVSILLPVATEVAEALFSRLEQGDAIGQALYEIRWNLANKGNLLGIVYTLYGLADLHVIRGT
jgi:hypothetical protein